MNNNAYYWFKLQHAVGFGEAAIQYIYQTLDEFQLEINSIFKLSQKQFSEIFPLIGTAHLSRASFEALTNLNDDDLFSQYQQLIDSEITIISRDDATYPPLLKSRLANEAPNLLYSTGDLSLIRRPAISVVGSRNVDEGVLSQTISISSHLSKKKYTIVSGFAKGVDRAAHRSAIENGSVTVAILPYGILRRTSEAGDNLLEYSNHIVYLSQFLPTLPFNGQNAMRRNVLVAAFSDAMIAMNNAVERDANGKHSGTFNAAMTALKHNIPVFVKTAVSERTNNNDILAQGATPFDSFKSLYSKLPKSKTVKSRVRKVSQ
jgi:DNA processing protein